jgi:hypothetical protein
LSYKHMRLSVQSYIEIGKIFAWAMHFIDAHPAHREIIP